MLESIGGWSVNSVVVYGGDRGWDLFCLKKTGTPEYDPLLFVGRVKCV